MSDIAAFHMDTGPPDWENIAQKVRCDHVPGIPRSEWYSVAKKMVAEIDRLEAEVERLKVGLAKADGTRDGRPEDQPTNPPTTKVSMACVKGDAVHLFEGPDDAVAFIREHGNDWSFAAWVSRAFWHPADEAKRHENGQ